MVIGHLALVFGIKRVAPEVKLGTAVLATLFLDLVCSILTLMGIEVVEISPGATAFVPLRFVFYPFSHSLAMAAFWAVLFAWVYRWRGGSAHAALWLALLVVSHWFLDLIVHQADLQLAPGLDIPVGLGLWNSVPGTILVEVLLLAVGVWLYCSVTRRRDRIGSWSLWGFLAVSCAAAFSFAPPPPNAMIFMISGVAGIALLVIWAFWIDRHRETVASS